MTLIRFRRGTTEQWAAADPVLAAGEPGIDTTTGALKIGDGTSTWTELTEKGGAAGLSESEVVTLIEANSTDETEVNGLISSALSTYITEAKSAARAVGGL